MYNIAMLDLEVTHIIQVITYAPVNVYHHHPPPWLPKVRPGDSTSPSLKSLYLGAELLIKSLYFQYSTINTTTVLSDHSLALLKPTQVEGGHVHCPTLGKGLSSISLSKPLIDPGGG